MGTTAACARAVAGVVVNNFLLFYGPGLKKGATIPYAEIPTCR
jgi:hypothetical protein